MRNLIFSLSLFFIGSTPFKATFNNIASDEASYYSDSAMTNYTEHRNQFFTEMTNDLNLDWDLDSDWDKNSTNLFDVNFPQDNNILGLSSLQKNPILSQVQEMENNNIQQQLPQLDGKGSEPAMLMPLPILEEKSDSIGNLFKGDLLPHSLNQPERLASSLNNNSIWINEFGERIFPQNCTSPSFDKGKVISPLLPLPNLHSTFSSSQTNEGKKNESLKDYSPFINENYKENIPPKKKLDRVGSSHLDFPPIDYQFPFEGIFAKGKNLNNDKINGKLKKKKKKLYQCDQCNKSFVSSGNLRTHKRIHRGERPFQCKECSKCFKQKSHLTRHGKTHTGERPFQCKECDKRFKQESSLKKHKRIHTGEKPFQCKECDKRFTQSSSLKRHERTHTGERPFKCKVCDKSFNQKGNLKAHELIHREERSFQCGECDKSFNQKGNLKAHELIHREERSSQCGKSFKQRNNLKIHKRVHRGEKSYQCDECGKSFNQGSNLKIHKRVHTGEKPFQCKICDKKFAQISNLSTHKRIHTGEKPFQCKECDKRFAQSSNLKQHVKIHTRERSFKCKICSKTFKLKGNLTKHIKRRCCK